MYNSVKSLSYGVVDSYLAAYYSDIGPGAVGGISTSAEWIWSVPDNASYADLSTQVTLAKSALATPLPGALPLFASGLAALGLVGRCRKRKGYRTRRVA